LECGVFVATTYERGALFETFAGAVAEGSVFASERTCL
jgi:hypothetical protein